jgi:hypothetical protein
MHWFWPNRLLSTFKAAICVLTAMGALEVLLRIGLGPNPAWLPPVFGTDRFEQFTRRLARVEQIERAGDVSDANLVAVLGLSQVRYDLDSHVLYANDPEHRAWLVLGGDGRNFEQFQLFGQTLVDSALRPRLVVLGLARAMIRREGSDPDPDASSSSFLGHLRRRETWEALRDCSWVVRHRLRMQEETFLLVYHSARAVRAAFGLPMSATYVPEADPWSSWTMPSDVLPRAVNIDTQWRARQATLTPDQFQNNDRQTDALVQLVAALRRKGATVVCVLMPETERLRAFYPPIIAPGFAQAIIAAGAQRPLKVIDLRDDFPDDEFHDDAHLDGEGRRRFSIILPALLQ